MEASLRALIFTVFAIGAFHTEIAFAQDVKNAEPRTLIDYDGTFRVIGQTDAESESDCIGQVGTPLCVVETIIAADARRDSQLQDIAYGKMDPKNRTPFTSNVKGKIGYHVVSVRWFSPSTVPAPQSNKYGIQPGDVAVYIQICNAFYKRCTEPDTQADFSALLRKGKYGWHAVAGVGYKMDLTDPR